MSDTSPPIEELFKVREEIEFLTKTYIERLAAEKGSLEDHAKLLITILDSIADGLIVVDKNEKIVLANKRALQMARSNIRELTRPELSQKYQFLKNDGKTVLPREQEPYSIALNEKRTAQVEGLIVGDDLGPEGLWIRSTASPVINEKNDLLGVVTTFQDITQSKRVQQQRDALSALITHDLKNHLASESMFLEMLAQEFSDKLSAEDVELLARLRFANFRYLEIANTLLELQRTTLHSTTLKHEKVDLQEVINAVLQLNQAVAVKRNILLSLRANEDLPKVMTVRSAIQQVFHNLVQNAINASESGQSVKISITNGRSSLVVRIADEGPGISQELIDAFTNSRPVTPQALGSSGLGLYLCRMLVEAHGGKISLKSKAGEGTSFTVELPLEPDGTALL